MYVKPGSKLCGFAPLSEKLMICPRLKYGTSKCIASVLLLKTSDCKTGFRLPLTFFKTEIPVL